MTRVYHKALIMHKENHYQQLERLGNEKNDQIMSSLNKTHDCETEYFDKINKAKQKTEEESQRLLERTKWRKDNPVEYERIQKEIKDLEEQEILGKES